MKKNTRQLIIMAVIVGFLFSGGAYILQKPQKVTNNNAIIAQCLTQKNILMYSAYWCPQCAKQKRLFGDAFQYIHEIECDPRGENSEPERCIEKNIKKTPTWIEETEDGVEIKRLQGTYSITELAEYFDCDEITNK